MAFMAFGDWLAAFGFAFVFFLSFLPLLWPLALQYRGVSLQVLQELLRQAVSPNLQFHIHIPSLKLQVSSWLGRR
jgi:hypothetical protein